MRRPWLSWLFLLWLLPSLAAASAPGKGRTAFRITGVAVSSRDGAPIPYCRLHVVRLGGEAPRAGGQFGGRGGEGAFRPGGGFSDREDLRIGGGFRGQDRQQQDVILADNRGRFSLDVPGAGSWRLSGIARGFRQQSFEEHDGFSAAIVLSETQPVGNVTFRLDPDAAISGLILDEAGEPVRDAQVRLEAAGSAVVTSSPALRGGFSQTDDRGHFELAGLAPGSYKLQVTARPWYAGGGRFGVPAQASTLDPSLDVVYPVTWFPGTADPAAADVIHLAPGEDRQADLTLEATPATHLTLPRTAPAPAEAGSRQQRLAFPIVTRVSGEGGFAGGFGGGNSIREAGDTWNVGGLSPGVYEIRLPGPDGRPGSDVRQIEVKPGAGIIDIASAQPLVSVSIVPEGTDARNLGALAFFDRKTGRRILANGSRGFGGRREQEEDDDGTRTVLLPPGTYEVQTVAGGAYITSMAAKGAKVQGMTVEVTDGSPILTLQTADGRADIAGIAQEGSKGVLAAMVLLVPATLGQPGDASSVVRAETNTDGSFTLAGVVPGPYILVALDHGWTVNWHDPATLARYLVHGVPLELQPATRQTETVQAQQP